MIKNALPIDFDEDLSQKRKEQLENLDRMISRFMSNTLSVIGALMVLTVVLSAIFAPMLAPFPSHATGGTDSVDMDNRLESPDTTNLMGTDSNGRDVFSRVIFGARISVMMAAVVLGISVSLGTILGLIAGYRGGWINIIIMRTADVFMSLPALVLAMVVAALFTPNLYIAMVAISLYWWTLYARIVQGEVLSLREEPFVEANRVAGASWIDTTFREILPNIMTPILVKATIDAGFIILVASGLGFLGLGTQPPDPDWGVMVARGRETALTSWWISTFPGLAIAFTVYGFNLLGDGLRDVFDVEVSHE